MDGNWHPAVRLDALPPGLTAVELGGERVLLVREGDAVRAFQGTCPHAGAKLDGGALCRGRIVCPWHMAVFDAGDGALLEPPAMRGLARYEVRVEDGEVRVALAPQLPEGARRDPNDARVMLLLGAGAGGAMAANALRDAGYAGRIVMVSPDPREPVDRTVLSKMAIAGQFEMSKVPIWDAAEPDRLGVERVQAEAVSLDAASRTARLSDGAAIRYDAALVATGGRPRRLDVPGADLPGVHVLRGLADAEAILAAADGARAAVVIGTSFIGLEAASALRAKGLQVTVLGRDAAPFARQFGERVSGALLGLHRAKGVRILLQAEIARLEGGDRVRAVVLGSGERLDADLVVVGIGVQPATEFVTGVRKAEDGGIVVDDRLRAADGLYAAGDVAAVAADGAAPRRLEHWRTAQAQARIAARNMAGLDERFSDVPFFWTYHHGKRIDHLGGPVAWDEVVVDGDLEGFRFLAWYVAGGEVRAVLSCERDAATALLAELMRRPLRLDEARAAVASQAG